MRAAIVALALLRFGFRLELAPEFDSNANRAAAQPPAGLSRPVASFLLRGTARGYLVWTAPSHRLRLGADLGGKYFFSADAAPQQTAVVRAQLEHRSTLSERVSIGVNADYHDAFQPVACPDLVELGPDRMPRAVTDTSCHRDFRLISARAAALFVPPRPRPIDPALGVDLAVRRYQWKPDPDLSFTAPTLSLSPSLRFRLGDAEDERFLILSTTGRFEYRAFDGPALRSATDLGDLETGRRVDLVGSFGLQLAWSGPFLASAGYLVEVDRSNSYGGSYVFQGLTLGLTLSLPAAMTAAARAQVLFFQKGTVPRSLTVEEESRDALVLELAREMGAGFTLRLRYAAFRNAAADLAGGYERHLVFLSAGWEHR